MKDKASTPINKTNVFIQAPLEIGRRICGALNPPVLTHYKQSHTFLTEGGALETVSSSFDKVKKLMLDLKGDIFLNFTTQSLTSIACHTKSQSHSKRVKSILDAYSIT